ncbi:MAG: lipoprotein [Spirochaetales bacterium]|jgi:hypothetical protein|nr:lipoprotein [Spirochaetales bacterium]
MKKWFITALAVLAVAGCSTQRPHLKPVKDKYTFQALYISLPATDSEQLTPISATTHAVSDFNSSNGPTLPISNSQRPTPEDIEALLKNPNVTIIEFPVDYAGVGETVTNALTEVYEANVDADIIDGEIVYEKETFDLGDTSTFTAHETLEDGTVSCTIKFTHSQLSRTKTYKTDEGIEVEKPYINTRSRGSQLTLPPYTWFLMGGGSNEVSDGTSITKTHRSFYVRVLPPK